MSFFNELRRKWHVAGLERQAATRRSRLPGALSGLPRWALALILIVGFGLVYYGPVGWVVADTQADLTLRPPPEALMPGGSVTAATASTLILQELDRGGWTPNDTFFKPTALNDEMPAFQVGVHTIVALGIEALAAARPGDDELADAVEELSADPALRTARAKFPFFGRSAGSHYRAASENLTAFNTQMADGDVDRLARPATARLLVSAIGGRLAESARELDRLVRAGPANMNVENTALDTDEDAEKRYARMRGQAYATTLLLRGMQADFDQLLRERQLGSALVEAIEALDSIAGEDALFVDKDDLTRQAYLMRIAIGSMSRIRTGLAT